MDQAFRNQVKSSLIEDLKRLPVHSLMESLGAPLLLLEPRKIKEQYRALQDALPMVDHHFAIKPAPHPAVVAAVDECGGFFDVMGNVEVDMMFDRRISPDRCIHTNPVKKRKDIAYAYEHGFRTFVVDNFNEVDKFRPYAGSVQLLVRLAFRNPEAKSDLSYKNGVSLADAEKLVMYAREQGLNVAGFTMHVGSQIHTEQAYVEAIQRTTELINKVEAEQAFRMTVLDIGGGFPVSYLEPATELSTIAEAITPLLTPLAERMRILSEPGRFVVASSTTLIAEVTGMSVREGKQWYYVDDGLYGSYSSAAFEDVVQPIFALRELEADHELELFPCAVGGPTCDSGDTIPLDVMLPELREGDKLISPMMGAYTWASATRFNSIDPTQIVVVGQYSLASHGGGSLQNARRPEAGQAGGWGEWFSPSWPYEDAAAISAAARQPLSIAPSM